MHILVDGLPIAVVPGQSVAVALIVAGILALRQSPNRRAPRGAFCLSGVCQECVVRIDGGVVPACLMPVRDGLVVALDRDDA